MIPRLPNAFASSFAASSSSCGISVGSISMIVTSVPKRWKIEANSQPMMPPPRTTSRLGTSVCASSPVGVDAARGVEALGSADAAGTSPSRRSRCLKVTSSPPSTAIVLASLNVPVPLTHSTPFALKSEATPPVICLTTPSFHSFAVPNSSWAAELDAELVERVLGFLVQRMRGLDPRFRRDAPDAQARAAELRLALDARDLAPSCAARMAAV